MLHINGIFVVMATDAFTFQSSEEKKSYVRKMFGEIAGRYDFFNHFLSLGFDRLWRKRAIGALRADCKIPNPKILDIACGTGDLAFEALRQIPGAEIIGLDLTRPMLDLFQKKIDARRVNISLAEGDVEALTYSDNTFNGITIGFGTRNFTRLDVAFKEIHRVLAPGGVFINLELAKPRNFPMRQLYNFYFNGLLPKVATLLSRHNSAYRYLPDSLRKFPDLEDLGEIMKQAGFSSVRWETMTQGIVAIHIAIK
ncbi:MAG: bifunctional demethylmenaquinone methyltransferase/2-methoxy-6-polyprenyl-1,4-benzoquinol methylase UbiE [Candidatus Kapaibacterium sp.]